MRLISEGHLFHSDQLGSLVVGLIEGEMVNALPLDVPIEVDVNTGDNWLDAH